MQRPPRHTLGRWKVSTYRPELGGVALVIPRAPAEICKEWEINIRLAELAPRIFSRLLGLQILNGSTGDCELDGLIREILGEKK